MHTASLDDLKRQLERSSPNWITSLSLQQPFTSLTSSSLNVCLCERHFNAVSDSNIVLIATVLQVVDYMINYYELSSFLHLIRIAVVV